MSFLGTLLNNKFIVSRNPQFEVLRSLSFGVFIYEIFSIIVG